jgi:hypothetical protein
VVNRVETRSYIGVDYMAVAVGNPLPNRRDSNTMSDLRDAEMPSSLSAVCESCGKRVATDAVVCLHCGELHPGASPGRGFLVLSIVFALFALVIATSSKLLK